MSPWDRDVWEMNIAVAEEAVRAGFREIQFDYVRFPEQYRSLPTQVHPEADSAGNRTDAIAGFLAAARERLHPLGATVTADVFGLSMNESRDVGIGQQWERISAMTDAVLPMVYPSHYFPTHLAGIRRPNRMPFETVRASVGMGVVRNERLRAAGVEPARIIPWLQAFTATWNDRGFPYGAAAGARPDPRAVRAGDRGLDLLAPGKQLRADRRRLRPRDGAGSASRAHPGVGDRHRWTGWTARAPPRSASGWRRGSSRFHRPKRRTPPARCRGRSCLRSSTGFTAVCLEYDADPALGCAPSGARRGTRFLRGWQGPCRFSDIPTF